MKTVKMGYVKEGRRYSNRFKWKSDKRGFSYTDIYIYMPLCVFVFTYISRFTHIFKTYEIMTEFPKPRSGDKLSSTMILLLREATTVAL